MREIILEEQEMAYRRVAIIEDDHIVLSDQEWREDCVDEKGNAGDMWVEDFMVRISKKEIKRLIDLKVL